MRYESPSQHTARLAQDDVELGGKQIRKRQAVIAVMGAANRDPDRFPDPDLLDIRRKDNRHVAFGFASTLLFRSPAGAHGRSNRFHCDLQRLENLQLNPVPVTWRENLGLERPDCASRFLYTNSQVSTRLDLIHNMGNAVELKEPAPSAHCQIGR